MRNKSVKRQEIQLLLYYLGPSNVELFILSHERASQRPELPPAIQGDFALSFYKFQNYYLQEMLQGLCGLGKGSSEFYETLFELVGVRNEEKGAFWEQNISLALLYNIEAISETSLSCSAEILRFWKISVLAGFSDM